MLLLVVNPQTSNAALENSNSWYEGQKSAVQTQQALFRYMYVYIYIYVYIFNLPQVRKMRMTTIHQTTRLCALHLGNGPHRMFGGSCQTRQHSPTREKHRHNSSKYPYQHSNVDMRYTNAQKIKRVAKVTSLSKRRRIFQNPHLSKSLISRFRSMLAMRAMPFLKMMRHVTLSKKKTCCGTRRNTARKFMLKPLDDIETKEM